MLTSSIQKRLLDQFERLRSRIISKAVRQGKADGDDLYQDVCLKVCEKALEAPSRIYSDAEIIVMAKNRSADLRRRTKIESRQLYKLTQIRRPDAEDPLRDLERKEEEQLLRENLMLLCPEDRRFLLTEESLASLSRREGINESTLRTRKARARADLKDLVELSTKRRGGGARAASRARNRAG